MGGYSDLFCLTIRYLNHLKVNNNLNGKTRLTHVLKFMNCNKFTNIKVIFFTVRLGKEEQSCDSSGHIAHHISHTWRVAFNPRSLRTLAVCLTWNRAWLASKQDTDAAISLPAVTHRRQKGRLKRADQSGHVFKLQDFLGFSAPGLGAPG